MAASAALTLLAAASLVVDTTTAIPVAATGCGAFATMHNMIRTASAKPHCVCHHGARCIGSDCHHAAHISAGGAEDTVASYRPDLCPDCGCSAITASAETRTLPVGDLGNVTRLDVRSGAHTAVSAAPKLVDPSPKAHELFYMGFTNLSHNDALLRNHGGDVVTVKAVLVGERIREAATKAQLVTGQVGSGTPTVLGRAVSLSQNGEDMKLNEQFFRGKRGGVFVEMGALDGLRYSNTYAFEQALGWSGVLIEANPASCKRLFQNRPAPTTRKLCTAVSNDSRPIRFSIGTDAAAVAAEDQLSLLGESYRKAWHTNKKWHTNVKAVTVASAPLGYLLRSAGVAYIDLFSLDVEGSEKVVLETMDWSIPVRVWCIEAQSNLNKCNPAKEGPGRCATLKARSLKMDQLMSSHGYKKTPWKGSYWASKWNDLYVWEGTWSPETYHWLPYQPAGRP